MSTFIRTVSGDIRPNRLGLCDSHDHLFLKNGYPATVNPALVMDDYNKTMMEVRLFAGVGGGAIVDAQPIGCGRSASMLKQVSAETGIRIVASTGFHRLHFYADTHWIHRMCVDEIAHIFTQELTDGMYIHCDKTPPYHKIDAKAGVVKVAIGEDAPTGRVLELLTAAAKAAVQTGAPVLCHTEQGKHALALIDLLMERDVPVESIIVCHADRTMQGRDNLLAIAARGAYVELDTIAREKYHSDADEIALIQALVEAGHEARILLGLDCTNERLKAYGGSVGLDYLPRVFMPKLIEAGISETTVQSFVYGNPAEAFSFQNLSSKGEDI